MRVWKLYLIFWVMLLINEKDQGLFSSTIHIHALTHPHYSIATDCSFCFAISRKLLSDTVIELKSVKTKKSRNFLRYLFSEKRGRMQGTLVFRINTRNDRREDIH